jgi:protein TonB
MISHTGKPNGLLWGLIFVSIGVHLLMLMPLAGLYRPAVTPVTIELDLRTISRPIQKEKPQRPKIPAAPKPVKETLIPSEPTPVVPLKNIPAADVPQPILAPPLPAAKAMDIAPWKRKIDAAPPAEEDTAETGKKGDADEAVPVGEDAARTQEDSEGGGSVSAEAVVAEAEDNRPSAETYRNQLHAKIPLIHAEADRLYRKKAQKRQLQGRTTVRVVIGVEGDIVALNVTESSQNRMLDQIALKAVSKASPFPRPPSGPTTIDIPINFKLI